MEDCDTNHRENHRPAADQRQNGEFLFFGWNLLEIFNGIIFFVEFQIIFKNLTDNAKNIAANAKIEDMGKLFKTQFSSKQDVKSTLTSVIEVSRPKPEKKFLTSKFRIFGHFRKF